MKLAGKLLEGRPSKLAKPAQEPSTRNSELCELACALRERIIPRILADKKPDDPVRIWVSGCARGEEAYTIATCLLEYLGEQAAEQPIKIFATDLDDAALAIARAGVYTEQRLRQILPDQLLRFFCEFNGGYRVRSQVRELCVFGRHDLSQDAPFSKLDLIKWNPGPGIMDPTLCQGVLAKLHRALRQDGLLMPRQSVEVGVAGDLFTTAGQDRDIFIKNTVVASPARTKLPAYIGPTPRRANDYDALDLAACPIELARLQACLDRALGEQEATLGELRRVREEAFSAMEKLRSVQEELQSSIEELRSINEELSSAKETLQSGNKQLLTLNEELENRAKDLNRVTDELTNVLSLVDIPIVILDHALNIRRFTPPAESFLGLKPADVGRPVAEFPLGIDFPELQRLASVVMETAAETSHELQREGRWYSLRVRPFRTAGNRVEGLLMAWIDVHEQKQKQQRLQNERNFVSAILEAAGDLLVVGLDRQGRIVHFNRVCQQVSGYSLAEVQGRPLWDFLVLSAPTARLKRSFETLAFAPGRQHEIEWITKTGARRVIAWTLTPVLGEAGQIDSVIATGTDQTRRADALLSAQESAATVHAVLETATQAIVAMNQEGLIIIANAAAEKMFGYAREELLGRQIEELIPHRLREQHAAHRSQWFADPLNRPMGAGIELTGLRGDGSEFPIEVSLSFLQHRHGMVGVSFISDITERRKSQQTLLDYQFQLRRLAASLISAQESENRELARELHDVFSQEIAVLSMEVSSLLHSAGARSRLEPRLAELGKKLGLLAQEIHRTSRQLHPSILDELGLEAALREQCEALSQHSDLSVRFTATEMPFEIPQDVSLCLYRVAQESLRNVRKHVGRAEVNLRLAVSPEGICLQVSDSGDGFDLEQARKRGGLGLISMEERARLVNGEFSIQSQPGIGTLVQVLVPLDVRQHETA